MCLLRFQYVLSFLERVSPLGSPWHAGHRSCDSRDLLWRPWSRLLDVFLALVLKSGFVQQIVFLMILAATLNNLLWFGVPVVGISANTEVHIPSSTLTKLRWFDGVNLWACAVTVQKIGLGSAFPYAFVILCCLWETLQLQLVQLILFLCYSLWPRCNFRHPWVRIWFEQTAAG